MAGNPKIGLDNVWVAPLTGGTDTSSIAPSWGTPVKLAGAVMATLNPNSSVSTDWGDNGPFFVGTTVGNFDMDLELIDYDPDVYAAMTGAERANGITLDGALDQSPWYAMGFRVLLGGKDASGNDIFEYFWLLKGKFTKPQMGGETKKDTLSYGHTALKAQFAKLEYTNKMMSHGRTDKDLSAALASAWFNAPVYTTSVNLSPVTVTAVLSGGTSGNVVFTFEKDDNSSFSVAEASAVLGSTVLIQVGGAEVAGAITWAGQATATPDLVFTPSSAFSPGSVYVTITSGVKDLNGVATTPYTTELTVS